MNEKSYRGFAILDPEKHRKIATKGGQNVPAASRSFSTNRILASEAGRKGGSHVPPDQRSFSKDRSLASEAGKKGGLASQKKKHEKKTSDMTS